MSDDVDASPLHPLVLSHSKEQRNMAKKPIAWELIETCSGNVLRRSRNAVLVAGWRRIIGATVVPVFRTRTNVKR